jgi:hypothetical protein
MQDYAGYRQGTATLRLGELTAPRSPAALTASRLSATWRGHIPWAMLPTCATYTAGHYKDAIPLSIERRPEYRPVRR